jgi:hypothetical protein
MFVEDLSFGVPGMAHLKPGAGMVFLRGTDVCRV